MIFIITIADYQKENLKFVLKNSNSIIKLNTKGRSGYIFEYMYGNSIRINTKGKPINTKIKVVVDPNGNITTAFPKKKVVKIMGIAFLHGKIKG
ncbi:hypothetical protein [Fusobacterium sp. PH5-44]|uniref:hypothetical protein n=1 Tax=unclassified Fusobacterium TaxID=2648384 RepID=UPI003D1EE862